MSSHIKFRDDDDSDYNATDSDDDYDENEKILLDNVRNRREKDSDSEEEVFGVGNSEDEDEDDENVDDDHSDIALSDIEGEEDDDLPDTRAWGKDKRKFYASDDLGGSKGKSKLSMEARLEMMQQEEDEADRLHKEQMAEFDDEDFMPLHKMPSKKTDVENPEEGDKEAKKKIDSHKTGLSKAELAKMTTEQKIDLMNKVCPLFFPIINDHKTKMERAVTYIEPIIKQYDEGKIPDGPAMDFMHHYYRECLVYTLFVQMFKVLKAENVNVMKHPIIEDLFQIRKDIELLEDNFQSLLPQIKRMLGTEAVEVANKTKAEKKTKKTKKRKLIEAVESEVKRPAKAVKFDDEVKKLKEVENGEEKEEKDEEQEEEKEGNDKKGRGDARTITYEMKKNKGLTPHRKKEQRNPRVKHKNKFRKAKINRKGAVREVRTETSRYGGEASGINPYVVKSRKIKY